MPAVTRGDAVDQVGGGGPGSPGGMGGPKKMEWRPTPLTYKGPLPSYVEKVVFEYAITKIIFFFKNHFKHC